MKFTQLLILVIKRVILAVRFDREYRGQRQSCPKAGDGQSGQRLVSTNGSVGSALTVGV